MTHDDAIKAVQEATYRSASEDDLREMLRACMDIHGSNPIALHRITHAAEVIRGELASRESAQQHQRSLNESHRANRLAWTAIAIATFALAVSAAQLLLQWGDTAKSKPESTRRPVRADSPLLPTNTP